MSRVLVRGLLLITSLLLASACGDDGTSPTDSPLGTFVLESINGFPLPFVVVQVLDDKIEITSGHITVNGDGTCSSSVTARTTESGQVTTETESDTCTWTNNANAVHFTWSDATVESGSWSGDRITVTGDGLVLVFER